MAQVTLNIQRHPVADALDKALQLLYTTAIDRHWKEIDYLRKKEDAETIALQSVAIKRISGIEGSVTKDSSLKDINNALNLVTLEKTNPNKIISATASNAQESLMNTLHLHNQEIKTINNLNDSLNKISALQDKYLTQGETEGLTSLINDFNVMLKNSGNIIDTNQKEYYEGQIGDIEKFSKAHTRMKAYDAEEAGWQLGEAYKQDEKAKFLFNEALDRFQGGLYDNMNTLLNNLRDHSIPADATLAGETGTEGSEEIDIEELIAGDVAAVQEIARQFSNLPGEYDKDLWDDDIIALFKGGIAASRFTREGTAAIRASVRKTIADFIKNKRVNDNISTAFNNKKLTTISDKALNKYLPDNDRDSYALKLAIKADRHLDSIQRVYNLQDKNAAAQYQEAIDDQIIKLIKDANLQSDSGKEEYFKLIKSLEDKYDAEDVKRILKNMEITWE